jgi:hypothetical protein
MRDGILQPKLASITLFSILVLVPTLVQLEHVEPVLESWESRHDSPSEKC